MAISSASASAYLSANGGSPPHHHFRRPSLHRPLGLSSPGVSAPRTHCPRDVDAFSYNPSHLPAWSMPEHLWECLPPRLQPQIASVQHAGAAVLTAFERLKDIRTTLLTDLDELDELLDASIDGPEHREKTANIPDTGLEAAISTMALDTPKGPRARHDSLATPSLSSTPSLPPPSDSSPIDTSDSSISSSYAASSLSSSPTDSELSMPSTPPMPLFALTLESATQNRRHPHPAPPQPRSWSPHADPDTPRSPLAAAAPHSSKTGLAPTLPGTHSCRSPFSMSVRHPHATYYAAELNELRCVALVRLRHAARRVDAEWSECKRVGEVLPADADAADDKHASFVAEFERWWAGRKGAVWALEERVRRVDRVGVGLGGVV